MNEDGQVAQLLVTASQNEVQAASLAAERAYIPAVREFARERLTEENALLAEAGVVFEDESFGTVESDDSRMLAGHNALTLERLATYNDVPFDRTYLRNQIEYHRWMIRVIDDRLMPRAHDDDLEQLLTRVRPVQVEHLRRAEALLASL